MMTIDDKIAIEGGVSQILQLIPDELQHVLIQIGENWTRDRWAIGDLTNQIKTKIRAGEVNASIMHIYQAISALLKQEVSARTVEYYSAVAEFYSPDVRDKYFALPHNHFYFAMRFGDRWPEVLGASLDYFDEHRRFPSVDYLRSKFAVSAQEPEDPSEYSEPVESDASGSVGILTSQFTAAIASLRALGTALENKGLVDEAERIEGMITELQGMY